MTIDIIGAGIGGLTTAIALKQKGIKTRIFEQAEALKPIGAGIILANNAMQVYEKLGLRQKIEKIGNPISCMNITRTNLQPLSSIDLGYFESKYQVKNIAIHRGALQRILIDCIGENNISLGCHLNHILPKNDGYELSFNNGIQAHASILIGADGIKSKVRQNLFPNTPIRNAKQICWRGISDYTLPLKFQSELNEAWGKSKRFGFVQIAKNKVYWYALKSFKNDQAEFQSSEIENYFNDYNPLVNKIITSTPRAEINTSEISDLEPTKNWSQENVCLIGDAAHATTPNMGQGACQAIEDAYVLSECLKKYETDEAFKQFELLRIPKAHQVVKASWFIGKMAHVPNPILSEIRNQLIRLMPPSINRKQSEQIFQLETI